MSKAEATLLLTLVAGSALLCLTSAKNIACFNANGKIKRVFCDGRDITRRLSHRMNPKMCDCINLDICKQLSIRAMGYERRDNGQTLSGIGVCQSAHPVPYRDWVCMKSSLDRAWKSQSMNPKNRAHWRRAEKTVRSRRCYGTRFLPCQSQSHMFWNAGVNSQSVDCVLQQCADSCKSCASTGPGKCDPDMCYYGSGTNVYTKKTRCNRKCRLDMLAWGWRDTPTTTGRGYMRLVDVRSKSTDTFLANKPGYYLAMVDMDECVFVKKNYSDWVEAVTSLRLPTGLLNQWSFDKTLSNRIAAVLQVGGIELNNDTMEAYPKQAFSGAPYVSVYPLGLPSGLSVMPVFSSRNCSISAVFKGFNYGPTTVESFVINKAGANSDASASC